MWRVLDKGREHAVSHFFYGATSDVLTALIERVRRDLPGVKVAGAISPPFGDVTPETQRSLVEQMVAADADIIWCALGAPRQEEWMYRHAEALKPTLVLGVGAAFNFLAGAKRRAPASVQRLGFEWLHRLVSEPRRLAPRYFRTNTQFLCDVAGETLKTVGGSARNVGIRRLR
jgi:N-acetylglucosaminyldiphosphoundecaprenol N-acetyl-beta-D-mannosaminyltransferase